MKIQQDVRDIYLAVNGDEFHFRKVMDERGYCEGQIRSLYDDCKRFAHNDFVIEPQPIEAVAADPKAVMRKAIEEGAKAWVADTFDAEMLSAMHKAGIIAQPLGFEISCIATLQLEMWERLGLPTEYNNGED